MVLEEQPEDETVEPDFAGPGGDPNTVPERFRVGSGAPGEAADDDDEQVPAKENITPLTDAERQEFSSLLRIGKRTKTVDVMGHKIVIRSLQADDALRIGIKTKEYRDTDAYPRAYQCATLAAGVVSAGGESWDNTLVADPSPEVLFEHKWTKAIVLYPLVIQKIYQEIIGLDAEFADLATKLGKL